MKDYEFTEITSMKARHISGTVIELFFKKIKLTEGTRFCEIPIEVYPVGKDKAGEQQWAADVFSLCHWVMEYGRWRGPT